MRVCVRVCVWVDEGCRDVGDGERDRGETSDMSKDGETQRVGDREVR